ncbi:MAG: helix-turn-helix domain-containing protein [Candidatus Cloacimonetes bacterium]|jgi:hypothetical protein|nr:helix-turn-helix domain-containing protein [Candidatus Cloacimonadota bacterium]
MKVIEQADGNKSKAAEILNINRKTLFRKIKNLLFTKISELESVLMVAQENSVKKDCEVSGGIQF